MLGTLLSHMQTKTILVIAFAVLLVVLVGALAYQRTNQPETVPMVVDQLEMMPVDVEQPVVQNQDETVGWEVYRNDNCEFKYPSDWGYTLLGPSSQKKAFFAPKSVILKLESDESVSDKEVGFVLSVYDDLLYDQSIMPSRTTNQFLSYTSSVKDLGGNQFIYYIVERSVARFGYEKGEKTVTADLQTINGYLNFDLFNYKYLDIFDKVLSTLKVLK